MVINRASQPKTLRVLTTPDASTVIIHLNKINVAFLTTALTDPLVFTPLPKHTYQNTAPADIATGLHPNRD